MRSKRSTAERGLRVVGFFLAIVAGIYCYFAFRPDTVQSSGLTPTPEVSPSPSATPAPTRTATPAATSPAVTPALPESAASASLPAAADAGAKPTHVIMLAGMVPQPRAPSQLDRSSW